MKVTTILLALALTVGTALGQNPQPAPKTRPAEQRLEALKSYLQLSDQQVQDITALLAGFRDSVAPLRAQMMAKRKDLRAEQSKTSPNATVVAQLKDEMKELQSQVKSKRDDLKPQLLGVLNEQQKTLLGNLEQALKNQQAARQAAVLGLIDAPQGSLDLVGPMAGSMAGPIKGNRPSRPNQP